jgi:hypothetical protein
MDTDEAICEDIRAAMPSVFTGKAGPVSLPRQSTAT